MKKALMFMAVALGLSIAANAQPKPAIQTVTLKTPTVQCESCKERIENTMARQEGVIKTNVNYRNKTTKVTFYTERTNIENVKTAIANAGYDADDVAASAEAYKKLPLCCKKPEDGGGPVKKH